jgi:murein DD-endopeptidase MepM/ murein hydrolase activator NlpD
LIASPVRGSGWFVGKGCCGPELHHRNLMLAANGRYVILEAVVNDQPEAPLGGVPNPALQKPADYAGNEVIVEIAPGKYADYVHLVTGSVSVRPGQHVRTGDVIGELGNTGNSADPHPHFGIHDSPSPPAASSLPFVIDRYTVEGVGAIGLAPTSP